MIQVITYSSSRSKKKKKVLQIFQNALTLITLEVEILSRDNSTLLKADKVI